MPTRSVIIAKRMTLTERQNGRCFYCNRKMKEEGSRGRLAPTLEHLIKVADGGTYRWDNLVVSCKQCNCAREERSVEEWQAHRTSLWLIFGEKNLPIFTRRANKSREKQTIKMVSKWITNAKRAVDLVE